MTIPIDGSAGITSLGPLGPLDEAGPGATGSDISFDEVFDKALSAHSIRAKEAAALAESFAAGKSDDIHGTMIAIKEVDIELRVISNVRRKVVDAFQELWRMNI